MKQPLKLTQTADAARLGSAFWAAETARSDYALKAVGFGLMALAAKPAIPHGKFQKWLSKTIADAAPAHDTKRITRYPFDLHDSLITARVYMHTAKALVRHLAQEGKLNAFCGKELRNADDKKALEALCAGEKINPRALTALTAQRAFCELIADECAGMSLRALRNRLAEATREVLDEDERERNTIDANAPMPPPETDEDGTALAPATVQMDFFARLEERIEAIDNSLADPLIAGLPKRRLLEISDALIARGEALRRKAMRADAR